MTRPSPDEPSASDLLAELERREQRVDEGGGRARLDRHRRLGRLGARERIAALVDEGSFVELGRHVLHRVPEAESESLAANRHPGDGMVAGLATIAGRAVAIYAHDPTVLRGAVGLAGAQKVSRLLDLAIERRLAVIALADSDGVRVEEGTDAIDAYGEIIRRTVKLRGQVPQLTLVCGLCVGAAAYCAALTDVVAMVKGQSFLFITGPKVTKVATGEDVDIAELGGAEMHARATGACHAVLDDETSALAWLKQLVGALAPEATREDPADRETPELAKIVPTGARRAYDMKKVLGAVFDAGSLFELSAAFAPNLITALARLDGRAVAVVASQPMVLAGCLDVDASRKGAAFIRFASANGLPVITFVDVPGYLPGKKQEEGGIVVHGATLLDAYGSANVPLLCLVVRKSYGGASVLSFAAQVRLALPTARVAPMGADATLEVVLGAELPDAGEPERAAREQKRISWLKKHDHAWAAAESGYLDQVVAPADARHSLATALRRLLG
jgi:acetyl-CoA carboxylase carboxyltransferase component